MDDGHESALATALQVAVLGACVAAIGVLATAPDAVLGGVLRARVGTSGAQTNGGLLAGAVLAAVGVITVLVEAGRAEGWSAILLGLIWSAASGRGLLGVPPTVSIVAAGVMPVAGVVVPMATGVLARGRLSPRARRAALRATLVAVALGILAVVMYDPFFDPTCVENCQRGRPLLELPLTAHLVVDDVIAIVFLAGGGMAIALGGWPLAVGRRDGSARRLMLLGCVLAGAALVANAVLALTGAGSGGPAGTIRSVATTIAGAGPLLIAIGLAWRVIELVRLRARVTRVADLVASATSGPDWHQELAAALGDRTVSIAYRLPGGSGSIDAAGDPTEMIGTADRLVTIVERNGRPVADIGHRASLDPRAVRAELTPAVLAALDNERLRAIALASLRALRESRARIVAIEDDERRRIERDLHDGAQQRLLAIAFELRLERTRADRNGNAARVDRLIRAEGLAFAALAELRRVARGVHPAILGQGGLASALSSLAEEASVPMTLDVDRTRRWPHLVEMTAYQVVAEALFDASAAGSSEIAVTVTSADDAVTLEIAFDGRALAEEPVRIADRVGATGGVLTVDRPDGRLTRIRAVMPCA